MDCMSSTSGVGRRSGFQPTEGPRRSERQSRSSAGRSTDRKTKEAVKRTSTGKPLEGKKLGLASGSGITKPTTAPRRATRAASAALIPSAEQVVAPAARRSLYDVAQGVIKAYQGVSQFLGIPTQTTRAWESIKSRIRAPTKRELVVEGSKAVLVALISSGINKYYNIPPTATFLLTNTIRIIRMIEWIK